MLRKKKKKPLNTFAYKNLLHSKSTYFYKQWSSWSNACHNIFANGFRWSSRHCEQNSGGFRLRDGANPTRSSLALKNPYSKNAYGRLGFLKSYVLPVFCSMALLLVLGCMVSPVTSGGEEVHAAYEPVTSTSGVSLLMETNDALAQETQASNGVTAYRYNRFKVNKGSDIDKYQVLVQAASGYDSNLVGAENGQVVNAVSGTVKGNAIDSAWGYSLAEGAITSEATLANLDYQALPGSGSTNTSATPYTETKEFTLAFAANIKDKPADHYQTNVLLSVAAGAGEVATWNSIKYMQDMTDTICRNADVNATRRLTDRRDSKLYWVTKLKDNNCWMTQNLDLDLNIDKVLTPDDTDVTTNWRPLENTQITAPNFSTTDPDAILSWDPAQGGAATYCNDGGVAGKCKTSGNSTTSINNGHDAQGNYYSWGAATAGSGAELAAVGNATSSICPSGWRLPYSGSSRSSKSFYFLLNGLTADQVVGNPYYFVYSGWIDGSSIKTIGNYGFYRSSTAGNSEYTYLLSFSTSVTPSDSSNRSYGVPVRCVAR